MPYCNPQGRSVRIANPTSLAIGYRPNRWQLVKIGYEWLKTAEVSGTRDNIVGIQLVTSIHSLLGALR